MTSAKAAAHLTTYLRLPCATCRLAGLCVLADQLREDLPLRLFGGVKPTTMELRCSSFEGLPERLVSAPRL